MASLLDVASVAKQVEIGNGQKVDVYGISGEGFAALMARFPEISKLMSGISLDKEGIMKLGPVALAAFIAAGTGSPNDEKVEAVAAKLSVAVQLDIIEATLKQTFPRGVDPFVKQLEGLGLLVRVAAPDPSPQSSPGSLKSSPAKDTKTS